MPIDAQAVARTWGVDRPLEEILRPWLSGRRWFAAKGRRITSVAVADAAWLPEAAGQTDACVLVDVGIEGDAPHRYALWLGLRAAAPASLAIAGDGGDDIRARLCECGDDPTPLVTWMTSGAALPTAAGGRLVVTDLDAPAAAALASEPITPVGAEQSNTSLRVGRRFVLKLFRRIQNGENPELEMLRFLATRTDFEAIARPRGALTHLAADGTTSTLGLVQDWVANEGDGWRVVVNRLEAAVRGGDGWPTWRDDIASLAHSTAAFHRASASDATDPAFAPRAVSGEEMNGWSADLVRRAAAVLDSLHRASPPSAIASPLRASLERLVTRGTALPADAEGDDLIGIRVHGDYHLGQTLKTGDGFVLIDFEGEPGRPIDERRQRHHALKDVAGMLRSFDYAMAVAAARDTEAVIRLRERFPLDEVFLSAYLAGLGAADLVPAHPGRRAAWLRFFTLDKAVYELEYEINHRPDWVAIPADAVVRLVDAD